MSTEHPPKSLMSVTRERVAVNNAPGSNTFSGWLAAVRAGITPSGEMTARSQAAPFVAGLREAHVSAALRAAAIRAINKDVADTSSRSLGRCLAVLAIKDNRDNIEQQIAALPLMNINAAALVLDGLIGRCAKHGIPINFADLERTLLGWGTGVGAKQAQRRNQLVIDFYRGPSATN